MITRMLAYADDKIGMELATRRALRDPVIQMGREAIRLSWIENSAMVETFRSQPKNFMPDVATQMMQAVLDIAAAPDPRMANRQRLVDVVADLALFEVLTLPPAPQPDSTKLRGRPGITGELWQRIPQLARLKMRDYFAPMGGVDSLSDQELRDAIVFRRYVLHDWASMHQILRAAWRDLIEANDWYRLLIENMCAFTEHGIRGDLGMEPALDSSSNRNPTIESLARSTLMNIVLSGAADPVTEWKRHTETILDHNL
jgi:hypothetical protein